MGIVSTKSFKIIRYDERGEGLKLCKALQSFVYTTIYDFAKSSQLLWPNIIIVALTNHLESNNMQNKNQNMHIIY